MGFMKGPVGGHLLSTVLGDSSAIHALPGRAIQPQ